MYYISGIERGLLNINMQRAHLGIGSLPDNYLQKIESHPHQEKAMMKEALAAFSYEYFEDFENDGKYEMIIPKSFDGYYSIALAGMLDFPEIISDENGVLVFSEDKYKKFYRERILPLYKNILPELEKEWKNVGGEGDSPLIKRINSQKLVKSKSDH